MNIYEFSEYVYKNTGNSLFFVGGFVRDRMMAIKTGDIDICSCIVPEELMIICRRLSLRCIPTGIEHGTVTIILQNEQFEHTTWRKDVIPSGRRCKVVFSDNMKEDALRRDFTINALYQNISTGEIFDFFGGKEHLKKNIICFIGDTKKRLEEDYLRIFRFFRFINRFGLKYNSKDLSIIMEVCSGIRILSNERVRDEILKIFKDGLRDIDFFIRMIEITGDFHSITAYFLSLLRTKQNHPFHKRKNVLHHTLDIVNMLDSEKNSEHHYWCIVFHDMFKPDTLSVDKKGITHFYGHDSIFLQKFEKIMKDFRLSRECQKKISFFIVFHLRISMLVEKIRSGKAISLKEYFNLIFSMYSHNPQGFLFIMNDLGDLFLLENKSKFGHDFKIEYSEFLIKIDRFEKIRKSIDKKKIYENISDKKLIKSEFEKIFREKYIKE